MEYYIDDMYEFLMDAVDQERTLENYHDRANWLADEELDWGDSRYDLTSMMESTKLGSMEDDQ